MFPVWNEETATLTFAKPSDTLVPPRPLAKAFSKQPELRPALLLKGSVLMDDVLGRDAFELFRHMGLLAEMSPRDLQHSWQGGLEHWWETLRDQPESRRRLLFLIWAAIAELVSDEAWQEVDLPCIRSIVGKWLGVGEAVFLNEPLPAQTEPGGPETRRFLEPFIPEDNRIEDGWVSVLRQRKQDEPDHELLSRVWDWIDGHARSMSLQEIVKDAVNAAMLSTNPDLSVFVPLGYWAKHRNRPDLLTHVLAESERELGVVPASKALLADPYVEHGQGRRNLFPGVPVIVAAYFEDDPTNGGPP